MDRRGQGAGTAQAEMERRHSAMAAQGHVGRSRREAGWWNGLSRESGCGAGSPLGFKGEPPEAFAGQGGRERVFSEQSLHAKYCLSRFFHSADIITPRVTIITPISQTGEQPREVAPAFSLGAVPWGGSPPCWEGP